MTLPFFLLAGAQSRGRDEHAVTMDWMALKPRSHGQDVVITIVVVQFVIVLFNECVFCIPPSLT